MFVSILKSFSEYYYAKILKKIFLQAFNLKKIKKTIANYINCAILIK